ncbi:MAG: thioesterase family protein [Eubacterium sp.]|nr:thioesterase family protein [Eubacterium sp.]
MEKGIKGFSEIVVTDELTAANVGSGLLPVYGTPYMVALMENTAMNAVAPYLESGKGTVGILINVEHTAATPVGMKVSCEAELVEVDGRRLIFDIKAFDEAGEIGHARHERFVIDSEKFLAKTNAKLTK